MTVEKISEHTTQHMTLGQHYEITVTELTDGKETWVRHMVVVNGIMMQDTEIDDSRKPVK